ncbi:MAG: pilin [Patescibacteria group bacterium]|jgi:hypothetical protein
MPKKVFFAAWLIALLFPFSALLAQNTTSLNDALKGLNETAGQVDAFGKQVAEADSNAFGTGFLTTKAGQIIGLVLSFIGVIFLILVIYAGILWMTASGNNEQITKAKGLIINAVIGLIVVFAAYAITNFIGSEVIK